MSPLKTESTDVIPVRFLISLGVAMAVTIAVTWLEATWAIPPSEYPEFRHVDLTIYFIVVSVPVSIGLGIFWWRAGSHPAAALLTGGLLAIFWSFMNASEFSYRHAQYSTWTQVEIWLAAFRLSMVPMAVCSLVVTAFLYAIFTRSTWYAGGVICAALATLFARLFYERYWKWRDCMAEAASSCVTPDGNDLTVGGAFWSVFAVLFAILTLAMLWCAQRQRLHHAQSERQPGPDAQEGR
jgi:hypothetical protein